jgi:osmotically-inducible protein OsmY
MASLVTKTDSEIQQDVLRELRWDTRVDETDVGVEVDSGIVTLTGTVSSWAKRVAAQEAAHRVRGVLDVADDIQVKVPGTPGLTDAEIARSVRQALEWDVFIPDEGVRSTVTNGTVTLEGDVDYGHQRHDAERAVRNLAGVRSVVNRILVKPPRVAPQEVRRTIEQALERRAEREAQRIDIQVHDGRVSLHGTVRSWSEREAVVGAAQGTTGVREVENHLRIEL